MALNFAISVLVVLYKMSVLDCLMFRLRSYQSLNAADLLAVTNAVPLRTPSVDGALLNEGRH